MGTPKDLNEPHVYVEALVRAVEDANPDHLAAWLADDPDVADNPFLKWYRYFAERLIDSAPIPEQGFVARPKRAVSPPKVGRNDICPCGSNKKFKACHLGKEDVVAWKLGAPTPAIRAMTVGQLVNRLPMTRLTGVPLEKCTALACTELAARFHREGRLHDALNILKGALDGERADPHILFDYWIARYAEWLVEDDRTKEAEAFLLDEYDAKRGVQAWQVAQKLAAYYIDQGDPDNAETWIESALEGDRENPFNHYLKGLMLHTLERWDEAVAAYGQAKELSDRFNEQERAYMENLVEEAMERARNHQPVDDDDDEAEAEPAS